VWNEGRSVVVSVAGDVDIATAAELSEGLDAALRCGARRLVCDLTGVGFLDASGLRALLTVRRRAIACCGWLDLACTQAQPRKIIQLTGLDAVFVIHGSVAEAVDAQEQRGRPGLTAAKRAMADMPVSADRGPGFRPSLSSGTFPLVHAPVKAGD